MNNNQLTKYILGLLVLSSFILVSSAHATFSIIGYDPETKEWGIAVASRQVSVGAGVPWAEAGSGAVAVQAWMDPKIGRDGLAMMKAGFSAKQTMASLMDRDRELQKRQFALIDAMGGVAGFSGNTLADFAGDRQGNYYSVQGNILAGEAVLTEMERVFLETEGPLALRLLLALQAGDSAGGDRRGRQSAALLVARAHGDYRGVTDRMIDLRVDNDPEATDKLVDVFIGWANQVTFYTYLTSESAPDLQRGVVLMDWLLEQEEGKNEPDIMVHNSMAWFLAQERIMPEKAIEIALSANQLTPQNTSIINTIAEAYRASGDTATGVKWLKEALEYRPGDMYLTDRLIEFQKETR
jgi:uncharacterized Ntn-hydrolase superfamily protein